MRTQSKELTEFFKSFQIWHDKGSPEMVPLFNGRGAFSNKLSVFGNINLFYLYGETASKVSTELRKQLNGDYCDD